MAKREAQRKAVATRRMLVQELTTLERRMDATMASTALSLKECIDSRWNQTELKFSNRFDRQDERFERLKGYFEGLVSMVVAQNTRIDKVLMRLEDRNRRLNLFEARN